MFINFNYSELLQISSAISTIENVYGNGNMTDLLNKVNDAMTYMDNAPVTDVYPGIHVYK